MKAITCFKMGTPLVVRSDSRITAVITVLHNTRLRKIVYHDAFSIRYFFAHEYTSSTIYTHFIVPNVNIFYDGPGLLMTYFWSNIQILV